MGTFRITAVWRTAVGQDLAKNGGDSGYYFPQKMCPAFKEKYAVPAIYRWRVMRDTNRWPNDLVEKIYIGEAEELTRRIHWVLKPHSAAKSTDTSKRLNALFTNLVAQGRKIVIDVADFDPFEINGIRFDKRDIGDRFKRRMLESYFLVEAEASPNFDLLNARIDPVDEVRQSLSRLTPRQARETAKLYGTRKASK